MTKSKKSIAIIILMLVLGCTLFGCAQNADYRTPAYFAGKYSNEHSTFYLTVTQDGETLIDDTILYFADGGYYTYKYYPTEDPTFVKNSLNSEIIEVVENISEGMGDKVTLESDSVKFSGSQKSVKIDEYVFYDNIPEVLISLDITADYINRYLMGCTYIDVNNEGKKFIANYIYVYVEGTIKTSDGNQYQYTFSRSFNK